jgi:anti-sigma-K factor RskA
VWLVQSNTAVGVGTFVPNAGSGWILIRSEQPLTTYQAVDVTIEPRGGSQTPTGQEVLRGPLALPAEARANPAEPIRFMPYTDMTD